MNRINHSSILVCNDKDYDNRYSHKYMRSTQHIVYENFARISSLYMERSGYNFSGSGTEMICYGYFSRRRFNEKSKS